MAAPGRCHRLFPSHAGDLGPPGQPGHRARWARAQVSADFEAVLLPRLPGWVEDLTGPAEAPLEDIGGGGWRAPAVRRRGGWPPVHPRQERRKYLLRAGGRRWLLKFAGLGAHGPERTAGRAWLAAAGFASPVAGLRHGFLVQPWLEEARPLTRCGLVDRWSLVARVGAYLGFRARPSPAGGGARRVPAELWEMARYNTAAALGAGWRQRWSTWAPPAGRAGARGAPDVTDNRLHAWEWLVLPGGRVLKADAVDHHAAHDLVGCQDIAWDVAGATVELGLNPLPLADPDLLAFLLPCYCAFQLGAWTHVLMRAAT